MESDIARMFNNNAKKTDLDDLLTTANLKAIPSYNAKKKLDELRHPLVCTKKQPPFDHHRCLSYTIFGICHTQHDICTLNHARTDFSTKTHQFLLPPTRLTPEEADETSDIQRYVYYAAMLADRRDTEGKDSLDLQRLSNVQSNLPDTRQLREYRLITGQQAQKHRSKKVRRN